MTARVLRLLPIGRVLFLFCNKTGHCRAWLLAASLCLGSRMMDCREGSVQQFWNRFILNLTLRMLATLVSRSDKLHCFLFSRSSRLSQKHVETISMSRPLLKALRAASRSFSAYPWFNSSQTALQSETTSPLKFHSFRRTCFRVKGFADEGSPLRSLNADMYVKHPLLQRAWKGGKQMSLRTPSGIKVVLQSLPPSVAPQPTQCFPHAATDVISFRFFVWKPFTTAAPITDARQGSYPKPSAILPHRGSLAMSTIGVKVHLTPMDEHSMAATLLPFSARVGLNEAAWARGMGKTVLKPWMTSLPMMSGILSLDCSMAIFCIWLIFSSFQTLRKEPTAPLTMVLMMSGERVSSPQEICCSCPIFSLRVMMERYCLMAASMSSSVFIALTNL